MASTPPPVAALLALLSALGAGSAAAHELRLAQFELTVSEGAGHYTLSVHVPSAENLDHPVELPDGCAVTRRELPAGTSFDLQFDIACDSSGAGERVLHTRWGVDGALLTVKLPDGTARSTLLPGGALGSSVTLPSEGRVAAESWRSTAWRFLLLGAEHVLIGWDHLAFVFCLALLARGSPLLWLISAFTVGHSISLALAHLGVVRIPIAPVEATIALSVVYMAREVLRQHGADRPAGALGDRRGLRGRLAVVGAFGLIHGLGFASVLGELGVDPARTVPALLFFNVGVEAGQVLFVAGVSTALFVFARLGVAGAVQRAATCAVGGLGLFWTVQRAAGW